MNENNNCITLINVYNEEGNQFEELLKRLINSGHLTINDVEYTQQIVIKTEKNGGM